MFLTAKYQQNNTMATSSKNESNVNAESRSGSGSGRFRNFINRPKHADIHERRVSTPSSPSNGDPDSHLEAAPLSSSNQYPLNRVLPLDVPSQSTDIIRSARGKKYAYNRATEFDENPAIQASPSTTPTKKIWEGAYNKFLRGNKERSDSPSLSPKERRDKNTNHSSIAPSSSSPSEIGSCMSDVGKKTAFSLIPGTKRLVSRTILSTPTRSPEKLTRVAQIDASTVPPFPNLKVSPRSGAKNNPSNILIGSLSSLDERSTGYASNTQREGGSVRGGKLFKSVFSRASSDTHNGTERIHRKHASMDALDVPMRNGVEKSNAGSSPDNRSGYTKQPLLYQATAAVNEMSRLRPRRAISEESTEEPGNASLDELLVSASSTSTGHLITMPLFGAQRAISTGGLIQSSIIEECELPPSMPAIPSIQKLHPRAQSYTYNNSAIQPCSHFYQHHQIQNKQKNLHYPVVPSVPVPASSCRASSVSDSSQQHVGLMLDDSEGSHLEDQQDSDRKDDSFFSDQIGQVARTDQNDDSEKAFEGSEIVIGGCPSSSPSSNFQQPPPDIKKAFMKFHNESKFAKDATSPFLGGETSSNVDLAGRYDSYVSYHTALMRAGGGPSVTFHSAGAMSERDLRSLALCPDTLDEHEISIHKEMRLLKPVQSTVCWQPGRRYLIAPAALATCSLPAINKLSGTLIQKSTDAATSNCQQRFGIIDLGEALMTYVGEKHHLSLGKWSSCRLVLRQNYLFEYDLSTSISGLPRGFVHLQHAIAYPHGDFQDALELQFYGSPCAKTDRRTLMIRVNNREERDHWIKCLNDAAKLQIEDLWEFDKDHPRGHGRYASIVPARRKNQDYFNHQGRTDVHSKNNCALKIVNKNEFWRRVVKGKERADTLVRELSVQSTLTAKCGRVQTFVQLLGFFETSDNVVMELELLEGEDLYEYMKSKKVLSEEEAGCIMVDILTTLDCMNRAGIVHRDIKLANLIKSGTTIKLCDFGMSTFVGVDGLVRGRCGTPGYVAPEILVTETGAGYGNQVDIFSAGVTLFVTLVGYEPFYGETEKELIEDNKRAKVKFEKTDWKCISPLAQDLVERMLKPDPSERITAKDALQHPWISKMKLKKNEQDIEISHASSCKNLGLSMTDAPQEGSCLLS